MAAVIAAMGLWLAPTMAQPGGPSPVVVIPVEQREVGVSIELVGSVEPFTRSLIASEYAGLVEVMPVEEGDRMEAGQLLCRLRESTRRLAYEQAQATLEGARAELAELEAGTRQEEIDRAKARMEETKAVYQKWEKEFERIRNLRKEGSASVKEYNDTLADTMAARYRYAQAKADDALAEAGPRKEVIDRARFAVEAQKARVAHLKYELDQMQIKAPFDGYVVDKFAEVGQWMTAGGPVVELIDLQRVLVRVDVPESAIAACHVGDAITVLVDALDRRFRGTIAHVIPEADPQARTFPIEIEVANDPLVLRSGMFVRAQVPRGPTERSLVVPADALLRRQGNDFVVAVMPNPHGEGMMGMPVPVKVGIEIEDWVAVSAPMLQVGVPVAVKGHDRIYGPQPVEPLPPEGASPSTQPATTRPSGSPES